MIPSSSASASSAPSSSAPSTHQSSVSSSSVNPSSDKQRPVLVYYYIPTDHDDSDHPNAFPLFRSSNSGNAVRLRDIKQRFPLPGKYHFRFKVKLDSSFFWIDIANDDSIVPQFNNRIIAKVLRVDWHGSAHPSSSPPTTHPSQSSNDNYHDHQSPPPPVAPTSASGTKSPPPGPSTVNDMLFLDSPSAPVSSQRSNPPKSSVYTQPPPPASSGQNTTNGLDDFFG